MSEEFTRIVFTPLYRLAFPALHIAVEELSTQGETVVLHLTARERRPVELAAILLPQIAGCSQESRAAT